jgi:protein-L-isoaspartate(D-aspartate) O-methyltransferase
MDGGMKDGVFEEARRQMVEKHIAPRGIGNPRVLAAMDKVPRHAFVPPELRHLAYGDHPLRIGCDQTISQPYMVALMTELLAPDESSRVLEIGTGSGYQTAVLAEIAAEVVSIERHAALAENAAALLEELGYENVTVHCGDGTQGWPASAPYDGILVTAGGPAVPAPLKRQLAPGGRLLCPVGGRDVQQLKVITRTDTGFEETESIRCVFVPLIGNEGWRGI